MAALANISSGLIACGLCMLCEQPLARCQCTKLNNLELCLGHSREGGEGEGEGEGDGEGEGKVERERGPQPVKAARSQHVGYLTFANLALVGMYHVCGRALFANTRLSRRVC